LRGLRRVLAWTRYPWVEARRWAPLPPLQQLGFGTSRWRLQGNATLGLRSGERGHHLFFLPHKTPLGGTVLAGSPAESCLSVLWECKKGKFERPKRCRAAPGRGVNDEYSALRDRRCFRACAVAEALLQPRPFASRHEGARSRRDRGHRSVERVL